MVSQKQTLEDYLSLDIAEFPVPNAPGVASEWLWWGEFTHSGGRLRLVDASLFASAGEGVDVALKSGKYEILVKMISFGRDRRSAALRISPAGSQGKRKKKSERLAIDAGKAFFFPAKFGAALQSGELPEEFKRLRDEAVEKSFLLGAVGGGVFGALPTGFGDGSYRVFALEGGGLEVTFLSAKVLYPFEVRRVSPEQEAAERLHWGFIESLWDPAWAAIKEGDEATRRFFQTLTRGQRALLAIDIFNKTVLRIGPEAFIHGTAARTLGCEVGTAYQTLGADEYFEKSKSFLETVPTALASTPAERMERRRAYRRDNFFKAREFVDWFEFEMKTNPIERRIVAYVEAHPEEFPKGK